MGLLNTEPTPGLLGDMEQMPWEELQKLRVKYQNNPAMQAQLAPYEHRAYAREQVAQNGFLAPAYAVMPAGYQIAKALHLTPSDEMSTPPSMDQMTQGMAGAWDGLKLALRR